VEPVLIKSTPPREQRSFDLEYEHACLDGTDASRYHVGSQRHMDRRPRHHKLTVLGLPCWGVDQPFHAVALVAGVARGAGIEVSAHDLNIEVFNHADDGDRILWEQSHTRLWLVEDLPLRMWDRYGAWIRQRLDGIVECDRPSLVGFSINMATRFLSVYAARYLKATYPAITVLFGGVDCFPKERFTAFLRDDGEPCCDILCAGECEFALRDFVRELLDTGNWRTSVPGFAYRDDTRGILSTGDVERPSLRGKNPIPAYDLLDLSLYRGKGALPFYLSRGCVYRCHFCSERSNFAPFRWRDAEEAFEELAAVLPLARQQAEVPTLVLADSNLNANVRELRRFIDLIIESGTHVVWGGQAHLSASMTTELLERMAEAGFSSVFWGFEHASQHVIDCMKKGYRQAVARRIIEDCRRLGIRQHLPILVGFPGERPCDVAELATFILRYRDCETITLLEPAMLMVRRNSTLHDRFADFGLTTNQHGYEWSLGDGTNTLPIRIARRYVLRQAHGNRELSRDGLVDTEEILAIDLDDTGVSRDLLEVLWHLALRADAVDRLIGHVSEAAGGAPPELRHEPSVAGLVEAWSAIDKGSAHGREWLADLVLLLLRQLRMRVACAASGIAPGDPSSPLRQPPDWGA